MKSIEDFDEKTSRVVVIIIIIIAILFILAIAFGIYVGFKVEGARKDTELRDLRDQLETANASLAEANVELAFWQTTIKGLAEGKQFGWAELKGRPSEGD